MLCQNCKLNESTIHLYTNVNGKQKQVDLCQNCYQIIKTDPNNPLFSGLNHVSHAPGGINPFFDDFFGDLNNFRAFNGQDLPNTPPTQSGGKTEVEETVMDEIIIATKLQLLLKPKGF